MNNFGCIIPAKLNKVAPSEFSRNKSTDFLLVRSPYEKETPFSINADNNSSSDLSLIKKARVGGADYLYSLLIGYKEPPEDMEVRDGLYYNKYYGGNLIAMPQPLYQDGVEYADGTNASIEQMAADVTEFLTWAAEPEMEARKTTGIAAVSLLLIMAVLSLLLLVIYPKIYIPPSFSLGRLNENLYLPKLIFNQESRLLMKTQFCVLPPLVFLRFFSKIPH